MQLKDIFSEKLQSLFKEKYGVETAIPLENPPKKEMGDFCFGAFHVSKLVKKNPQEMATELSELLSAEGDFSNLSTSGPFVNFSVPASFFVDELEREFAKISEISKNNEPKNENIVIDYIGINVGKPMHIGHMCTPNIGQALVNLYTKLGYNVIGDSHIGDWGIIFGKLITAIKIYGGEERLQDDAIAYLFELYVKITADCEQDESLEERTREEFKMLSEGNPESIELWEKVTKESIKSARIQLDRLNVRETYNIGESFYEGLNLPKMENYPDLKYTMNDIVSELISKEIAVRNEDNSVGITFPEETKMPSCILEKRNGTKGYFASDLASIKYRIDNWNPSKIIYCTDNRQKLHFSQAFKVAEMADWINERTALEHAHNGFVSLKDGAMSTRKGTIIPLKDLLDEAHNRAKKIILEKRDDIVGEELEKLAEIIGIGAIKFGYLSKNRTSDIIFDWDEFMTFEGKSGPYIAYNFVRANKILTENTIPETSDKVANLSQEETELIKSFAEYESVLQKAAVDNSPHVVASYAYDISKKFSSFYNACRIDTENQAEKATRLQITALYKEYVKDSMTILGIILPEKM